MNNVIANILVLAIFVGGSVIGVIATMFGKRIDMLQREILRNERYTKTQLMSMQREIDKVADRSNSELAYVIDKVEAICRDLRGETYAIEFWGGDCYGGFKKNGDPIDVGYSEAVLMTRQEAERIKKMLGTGAIVNRSKTILKNLEEK